MYMKIKVNNVFEEYSQDYMTVSELLEAKKLPKAGCAVAVNDRLVKAMSWDSHKLSDGDNVTLISAAYGG